MLVRKSPPFHLLAVFANLYLLTVLVAASYFNWQYAREHGFGEWLAWGEIVPTEKALVWPYFAMRSGDAHENAKPITPLSARQTNEMNIMSAKRAIDAALQGNYIIDSRKTDSPLGPAEVEKVIEYSLQSLRSADAADEETLNKLCPEFGTRFKKDFCEGERLLVSGLRNNSRDDLVKSSELDRAWKDWFNANRKQCEDAFNAALR